MYKFVSVVFYIQITLKNFKKMLPIMLQSQAKALDFSFKQFSGLGWWLWIGNNGFFNAWL